MEWIKLYGVLTGKEQLAEELFEKLKEKDIYVRYFNKPRIHNYLRITIGTDAEMDEFLSEVENYLKESGRL